MITEQVSKGWDDYELLDTGNGQRLERLGQFLIVRPEPHALWKPTDPRHGGWQRPDLYFDKQQGGVWLAAQGKEELLQGFKVKVLECACTVKPTSFRHIGIFPEQHAQWEWLAELVKKQLKNGKKPRVLNLFAYTGIASLVAAQSGADVCHVDAAKGTVYWASDNARLSKLDKEPIRWIAEDVRKLVQREVKRGAKYDVILLDPPVFGRGRQGEVWRLEEDLPGLLKDIAQLAAHPEVPVLMNFYATDLYPHAVERMFAECLNRKNVELGTVGMQEFSSKRYFQTGYFLRA